MRYLLVILLTLSTTAQAELDEWYKKAIKVPNPNELPLLPTVSSGCKAMSVAELQAVAEGVLVRSRIKPLGLLDHLKDPAKYPIYLSVSLDCFGDEPYNFNLRVAFGKAEPEPLVAFEHPYGTYGRAPTATIKSEAREELEKAITDYVKVNFDL
jgi:hypothetical protein